MHIKALEIMNSTDLSCNIKFMIEGEEEIGYPVLKILYRSKNILAADVIYSILQ